MAQNQTTGPSPMSQPKTSMTVVPSTSEESTDELDRTNLYIKGLWKDCTQVELDDIFKQFGVINQSRVYGDGVGFVRFDEASAAEAAIRQLSGKPAGPRATEPLLVKYAFRKSKSPKRFGGGKGMDRGHHNHHHHQGNELRTMKNTNNVYLRCLPKGFAENDLLGLCSPFGELTCTRLRDSGVAFVRYKNAEDAALAIRELNGRSLAGPDGEPLLAKLANSDPFQPKISFENHHDGLTYSRRRYNSRNDYGENEYREHRFPYNNKQRGFYQYDRKDRNREHYSQPPPGPPPPYDPYEHHPYGPPPMHRQAPPQQFPPGRPPAMVEEPGAQTQAPENQSADTTESPARTIPTPGSGQGGPPQQPQQPGAQPTIQPMQMPGGMMPTMFDMNGQYIAPPFPMFQGPPHEFQSAPSSISSGFHYVQRPPDVAPMTNMGQTIPSAIFTVQNNTMSPTSLTSPGGQNILPGGGMVMMNRPASLHSFQSFQSLGSIPSTGSGPIFVPSAAGAFTGMVAPISTTGQTVGTVAIGTNPIMFQPGMAAPIGIAQGQPQQQQMGVVAQQVNGGGVATAQSQQTLESGIANMSLKS